MAHAVLEKLAIAIDHNFLAKLLKANLEYFVILSKPFVHRLIAQMNLRYKNNKFN